MVDEITRGGLIISQAAQPRRLIDEFVALCDWPLLLQPTIRLLFREIDGRRPEYLLFWLETDRDITPAAQLVARLRERGPRPYRIAVAHCLDGSAEQTFRTAGVHSYFAVSGDLRALVVDALMPMVDRHRAASRRGPRIPPKRPSLSAAQPRPAAPRPRCDHRDQRPPSASDLAALILHT